MAFTNVRIRMNMIVLTAGWSESFYRAATAIDSGVISRAQELVTKRKAYLNPADRIVSVRITAVQQKRLSQKIRILDGQGQGTGLPDQKRAALVVPLRSTGGHLRNYEILGVNDAIISFDAAGNEIPPFGPNLQAYLDYIIAPVNGWQMQVQVTSANDAPYVITGITVAAGIVTMTISGAPVLAAGDKINVTGVKGYKVKNFGGDWKVLSWTAAVPPALTGTLTATTNRYIDPQFFYVASSGRMRIKNNAYWSYEGVNSYDPQNIVAGTRKVGRPIDAPRGRR